jgi:DNA ligase-1
MQFLTLVHCFERLSATSGRLEMGACLSDLFREAEADEIGQIIYLTQGELLPAFHGVTLGLADKYLLRALAQASGVSLESLTTDYQALGDIGTLAEKYLAGASQARSVSEVYDAIFSLTTLTGEGSVERKVDAVSDLFRSHSAMEAKYVARFIAGKLRLGVGDATVLLALARFLAERRLRPVVAAWQGLESEEVLAILVPPLSHLFEPALTRAYHITSDLGWVAKIACQEEMIGLQNLSVRIGYPIRPALCERLISSEEIIAKMGRCAVEVKYDGFRCQLHKSGEEVTLFSRNQERTTAMFPEIVEAARRCFASQDVILEGEALAFNEATGALLPFQMTSQRKRKHGVEQMAQSLPLKFFVFDLLFLNGQDWTGRPYAERRAKIVEMIPSDFVLTVAEAIQTDQPADVEAFFDAAVGRGLEGIVAKRLSAPYAAGARNFNWIKLKRSYRLADSLDLCIVGYWAGQGQRAAFGIGTILGAVYDPASDRFYTVSKIGSGFSEDELVRLKAMLDEAASPECPPAVCSEIVPDVWVHPKYVVAVTADEITRSQTHSAGSAPGTDPLSPDTAGYALRFPRVSGFVREDKSAHDATTVDEVIALFNKQGSAEVNA